MDVERGRKSWVADTGQEAADRARVDLRRPPTAGASRLLGEEARRDCLPRLVERRDHNASGAVGSGRVHTSILAHANSIDNA
jgi:hypothetical protein